MTKKSSLVDVGRITAVFGINGWVKVQSHTEPPENILNYRPWWLKTPHGVKPIVVDASRRHATGFTVHFEGIDDRDTASGYCQINIAVERNQLPELEVGEFYWHQLQGLQVISEYEGGCYRLGTVRRLLETGANDVLVVQGNSDSVDRRERLIPYVPNQFVKSVDLDTEMILVNWDPAF
ncbi:MAG: ribosome maturation factor RimM [Exilibacterium sp.]